ncbi:MULTISPECIES: hypothetical protein [unclassified Gilliamella]|uniref:hypothetical protein n=1 Tax=unclassified Gilliamella TaxID=2685620 RepID=UPI00080F522D|nr:hypothetical protein [Gilliamella apicola]OCG74160.1 hypothetical protein A9G42_10860 [Gilliamella apicola]
MIVDKYGMVVLTWSHYYYWFFSSDEFPLTEQYPEYFNKYAIDAWIGQIQVWGKRTVITCCMQGIMTPIQVEK